MLPTLYNRNFDVYRQNKLLMNKFVSFKAKYINACEHVHFNQMKFSAVSQFQFSNGSLKLRNLMIF